MPLVFDLIGLAAPPDRLYIPQCRSMFCKITCKRRPCTLRHRGRVRAPFNIKGRFMKVLVAVKRVVDYNVKVRVKSDGTGVDLSLIHI